MVFPPPIPAVVGSAHLSYGPISKRGVNKSFYSGFPDKARTSASSCSSLLPPAMYVHPRGSLFHSFGSNRAWDGGSGRSGGTSEILSRAAAKSDIKLWKNRASASGACRYAWKDGSRRFLASSARSAILQWGCRQISRIMRCEKLNASATAWQSAVFDIPTWASNLTVWRISLFLSL